MKAIIGTLTLALMTMGLVTFNNSTLKAQASTKTVKLEVKGMSCQNSCANGLDRTFKETEGIIKSKTSYANGSSEITYDPTIITEKEVMKIVKKRGFATTVIQKDN